jgi:hypothetical protein
MANPQANSRPIGWWLKEADARLDAAFDRALADRNVDRRDWQVLALLARRPTSREEIVASLTAFDPPVAVEAALNGLDSLGWIEGASGLLRLTPDGEHEYAALAPLIDAVRGQVTEALPQDDYATLIGLLERLVAAL